VPRQERLNPGRVGMTNPDSLTFGSPLPQYELQAKRLLEDLAAGDSSAAWRFKWLHPRFRGKAVVDVPASLDLGDARLVVARESGFEDWQRLSEFVETVTHDGPVARFEAAVEAVVSGDLEQLCLILKEHPELARAQSVRRHHSTLLHYTAANGVEAVRQKTPVNAVEVVNMLLDTGAEVDALSDAYDTRCTTLGLLVSSCHPANAGLQVALAEILLDRGAAVIGPEPQSAIVTALAFGYSDTAAMLARRAPPVDDLTAAAGLGWSADVMRLLPNADASSRHVALALAAQHGQVEIVKLLLDAGEDPNRFNPDGFHAHSTPLHQAAWADRLEVVRLLVDREARLDVRDTIHGATPLGWALHGNRTAIVEFLRSRSAPQG